MTQPPRRITPSVNRRRKIIDQGTPETFADPTELLERLGIITSRTSEKLRAAGIAKRTEQQLRRMHRLTGCDPSLSITTWVLPPDPLPQKVLAHIVRPYLRTAHDFYDAMWQAEGWHNPDAVTAWQDNLPATLPGTFLSPDPVRAVHALAVRARDWAATGRTPQQATQLEGDGIQVADFIQICQWGYTPIETQDFIEAWLRATPPGQRGPSWFHAPGEDQRFNGWLEHRLPADKLVAAVLCDLDETEIAELDEPGWIDAIAAAPMLAALRTASLVTSDDGGSGSR